MTAPDTYAVDSPDSFPYGVGTTDVFTVADGAIYVTLDGVRKKLSSARNLPFVISQLIAIQADHF